MGLLKNMLFKMNAKKDIIGDESTLAGSVESQTPDKLVEEELKFSTKYSKHSKGQKYESSFAEIY